MPISERVVHVLRDAPARDERFCAQQAQLLRDGWQRQARGMCELGDAPLALGQASEQLEARHVTSDPEETGGPNERLFAETLFGKGTCGVVPRLAFSAVRLPRNTVHGHLADGDASASQCDSLRRDACPHKAAETSEASPIPFLS